jgi:hypothetical protein
VKALHRFYCIDSGYAKDSKQAKNRHQASTHHRRRAKLVFLTGDPKPMIEFAQGDILKKQHRSLSQHRQLCWHHGARHRPAIPQSLSTKLQSLQN